MMISARHFASGDGYDLYILGGSADTMAPTIAVEVTAYCVASKFGKGVGVSVALACVVVATILVGMGEEGNVDAVGVIRATGVATLQPVRTRIKSKVNIS
jgi:hypothetical protein